MTSRLLVDKIEGKTTSGSIQMPSGHIIQTVDGTDGTNATTTSTSFSASNLSITITPKYSTSKLLVGYTMSTYNDTNQAHNKLTIYRSIDGATATNLGDSTWGFSSDGNGTGASMGSQSAIIHDSPSTISSITYTVYGAPHDGGSGSGTMYFNINGARGQMFAQEIAV